MSTPILNPDSFSTNNTNPRVISALSQTQIELGKMLHQHDPSAIRLYDFLHHVKVFLYNSNAFRWENYPYIEGHLFVYVKQQIIHNQRSSVLAFAVINREQHFIQEITPEISAQAENIRLFYEIRRNNKYEVFCLHFTNENDCQRIQAFLNRSIRQFKERQPSRPTITGEFQLAQPYEQERSDNISRQTNVRLSKSFVSFDMIFLQTRNTPTPNHSTVEQLLSVINANSNSEDPTSSLKRLLNIPSPNNESILPSQQSINLLPPSAFHSISHARDIQLDREHIRNVFLDLVQNNDQFVGIINQACYTHHSQ